MAKYWVIAPGSSEWDAFDEIWRYDLENNVISIGWSDLGDVSGLDEHALKERIEEKKEEMEAVSKGQQTKLFNTFWTFYHVIEKGDIIIARHGRKKIAAIGTVTQTAFYDEDKGKYGENVWLQNFIGVKWHDSPRDKEFDRIVFGMNTLYEIPEDKYKEITEDRPVDGGEVKELEFVLEKYLEEFIVSNFDKIFKDKLILYKDPDTGDVAQQYQTEVGKIDILAKERSSNSFVVIELKKGEESDKVVAQTLRYMGWVKENLCEDDQEVKGMIICKEADDKLKFALKMVNNVGLKHYSISFELHDK